MFWKKIPESPGGRINHRETRVSCIPVTHFEDYSTPVPAPEAFLENMAFFPGLTAQDLEYHQGGIQARLDGLHDFYIKPDRNTDKVIHLLGIDSPGLTAAPAIAKYVANLFVSDLKGAKMV